MQSQSSEQPLAFQLAAALERYDAAMSVLLETWLEPDLYVATVDELKGIKILAAAFPNFTVLVIELSITHSELVHALWSGDRPPPKLLERHCKCLEELRSKAVRHLRGWQAQPQSRNSGAEPANS